MRRHDLMRTGVRSWELAWTDELEHRVLATRARLNSAEPPAHADIRYLIAADVPRLAALADDEGIPDDEFYERCLSLRGHPLEEAPARRLARERARSWEFFSDKPQVPATAQEFFAFYEMANRLEPHYCTTIPARFRVENDPLPQKSFCAL